MTNELERIWKKSVIASKYYVGIYLEGQRKTMKHCTAIPRTEIGLWTSRIRSRSAKH
jgi:hypothetical protein